MTAHYDLKQQEKQQWCFGGWAGVGGVTNIFVIYLGGSSMFFQRDWGGRQNFCLPHENVTAPPPHLVINDSSLTSRLLDILVQNIAFNMQGQFFGHKIIYAFLPNLNIEPKELIAFGFVVDVSVVCLRKGFLRYIIILWLKQPGMLHNC